MKLFRVMRDDRADFCWFVEFTEPEFDGYVWAGN
jgi:hypothetical protein